MKIKDTRNGTRDLKFSELNAGDGFEIKGRVAVRMKEDVPNGDDVYNAYHFESGQIVSVPPEAMVRLVNLELVVS